jgi:hypothetical protein
MLYRNVTCIGFAARRWLWLGSLVVLLCILLPTTVHASSPNPDQAGPETCAQCHPAQAAIWENSPHAQALETIEAWLHTADADSPSLEDYDCLACHTTHFDPGEGSYSHAGVTCEACHGPFVQGHPQNGVMNLQVDASVCRDCHSNTYQEWHETAHAGAEVQCISCHVPHTQETRLDNSALCESCHREEAEHKVHHDAGVHCADCHLPSASVPDTTGDIRVMAGGTAPSHSFELAVESCANCHAQSIHENVLNVTSREIGSAQVSLMTERAKGLARELEDAKRTNRNLQATSVVSLGLGLGTGGVLGAICVLIVGFIVQGRSRR